MKRAREDGDNTGTRTTVNTTTDDIVKRALADEQAERAEKLSNRRDVGGRQQQQAQSFLSDSDLELDDDVPGPSARDADGDIDDTETDMRIRAQERRELAELAREGDEGHEGHEGDEGDGAGGMQGEDDMERLERLERDHGYAIEAFTMREGRKGDRDGDEGDDGDDGDDRDEGNVDNVDNEEADGWLEGKQDELVVDEKTRRRIEEVAARRAAAIDADVPAPPAELARWQFTIYKVLREGETVAGALKRLGGKGGGGGGKKFLSAAAKKRLARAQKGQLGATGDGDGGGAFDREKFDELTSAATMLMEQGDVDVYGRQRDYFKRAAARYIDVSDEEEGGMKKDDDDDDDDMFA